MLRGYRLLMAAIAGLAIAFGAGLGVAGLLLAEQKQERSITADPNVKVASKRPKQFHAERSGIPASIEAAISNPQPATGQDHEKRDLAAQEASAAFAWWMVVVSGLGFCITTVGTILLYQQIKLTRRAVEDTGEATVAMREANDIARDTAKRQLRAYIGVDECWIEWDENTGEFVLGVRLRNSGQTPAYNVRLMGESFGGNYPLAEEHPFAPIVDGYESTVNMSADICCLKRISTTGHDLTMNLVRMGELGLYIQGICTYEDAFQQPRETKFRYVLGGQTATIAMVMHAAETGNSAT